MKVTMGGLKQRLILLAGTLWFGILHLVAQVSYGGFPLMNESDFTASRVIYALPPEDPLYIDGLKKAISFSFTKAVEYATERPVDISPDFNGEWIEKDGVHVWRAHLISPGAYSLGIMFSEFQLDGNVQLFIYDPSGLHVKGAFTGQNNKSYGSFYVGHLPGEELIIELQVRDPLRRYGRLRISALSHAFLPVYSEGKMDLKGLGDSQDCEVDVNCEEGDDWQIIKRSVCHISTSRLFCTGALINNSAYDGKPYVITAEHCINKDFTAENSVFYFGYENSECGLNDGNRNRSVSGSTLVATGDSIDFTLVKLSTRPPREYNVYFAGWDMREQGHVGTVTLHHPNADAMKISFDYDPTADPTSVPGDLNDYFISSNYWIKEWDIGTTEGGSSGCPLFNSSKRLIGVLSGGLASCGDSIGYDNENKKVIYSLTENRNDYFSKLYYGWDYFPEGARQLKKWLDPIESGQLSIGGLSSMSVGVKDAIDEHTSLMLYPNPSQGHFQIQLPYYTGKQISVSLFDITGRKVYRQSHTSVYPMTITLEHLPSGIYMVNVSDENAEYSGRLVLQ
jgi:hypothetical protein